MMKTTTTPKSVDDLVSNLVYLLSETNETPFFMFDYPSDHMQTNNSVSPSSDTDPQQLVHILSQLLFKPGNNQSQSRPDLSSASTYPTPLSSFETFLSSPISDSHFYRIFAFISLWFVLIVNPIVIFFGVIGNLLTIYLLIRCNIAKLPVSFYTVMLNVSDTLNLLIPVLIFWLDNCINRTPERGYFRDQSNFLCKALMCPDQLFAALSAWYMCAISFNRWYSVYRPSSYFFRTTVSNVSGATTAKNHTHENNHGQKKFSSGNVILSTSLFASVFCSCFTHHIRFRKHFKAFRSIACITLVGMLCCLYPIFMHELRPVMSTNAHIFDRKQKITHTFPVIWKRCYYSQKHEYAYDVIGIVLSCLLHLLPLTFVGLMNIMIIVRLKQRQRLMSVKTHLVRSPTITKKNKKSFRTLKKELSSKFTATFQSQNERVKHGRACSQPIIGTTQRDQSTSTDFAIQISVRPSRHTLTIPTTGCPASKRHRSRDRAITIMLVSVALSYLILTLPYRLFWSYNVYIKRMHPKKLSSSVYLLKMHYIDHVLRSIRNIHYGTNFIFFLFLCKTFRRKFRQIFLEKFLSSTSRFLPRNSSTDNASYVMYTKNNHQRQSTSRVDDKLNARISINDQIERCSQSICKETPGFLATDRLREDEIVPIIKLEQHQLTRYDNV